MKKILLILIALPMIGFGQDLKVFPDINIKSLDGKTVSIKEINNNNNPIVVIFWATWARDTKTLLNTITYLYNDWQNKTGVKIVIVSIDNNKTSETTGKIRDIVKAGYGKAGGWPFDCYMDANHKLRNSLGISKVHNIFVLNGKKEIVKHIKSTCLNRLGSLDAVPGVEDVYIYDEYPDYGCISWRWNDSREYNGSDLYARNLYDYIVSISNTLEKTID